ncbi:MAG: hypothetical protein M9894_13590 [Planctomycetes bacterium]|nr:hypothetical protein [Planctomycetota bacterium]
MVPEEKPRPPGPPAPAERGDIVVQQSRCPFCHEGLTADAAGWVACAACLARHHEPCWGEASRCAACGGAERLRREARRARLGPLPFFVLGLVVMVLLAAATVALVVTPAEVVSPPEPAAPTPPVVVVAPAPPAVEVEPPPAPPPPPPRPPRRPVIPGDERFELAQRVDELRTTGRSGARSGVRRERARSAARQATTQLALARHTTDDAAERARLDAARARLEKLYPPPRPPGAPLESILEEHTTYLMPPRPDHPEFERVREVLERTRTPGVRARLQAVLGDAAGALELAGQELDRDAASWIGWLARGEALALLGDHAGADLALHLAEAFAQVDPTWTLLARVELARARGGARAELDAAFEALEVGQVPEFGGHLDALLWRIARLERELGE